MTATLADPSASPHDLVVFRMALDHDSLALAVHNHIQPAEHEKRVEELDLRNCSGDRIEIVEGECRRGTAGAVSRHRTASTGHQRDTGSAEHPSDVVQDRIPGSLTVRHHDRECRNTDQSAQRHEKRSELVASQRGHRASHHSALLHAASMSPGNCWLTRRPGAGCRSSSAA
jgi:hypothetical protein